MSRPSGHWHLESNRRSVHAPNQRVTERFPPCVQMSRRSDFLHATGPLVHSKLRPSDRRCLHPNIASQRSSAFQPRIPTITISYIPYRIPSIVALYIQKSRPTDHRRSAPTHLLSHPSNYHTQRPTPGPSRPFHSDSQ